MGNQSSSLYQKPTSEHIESPESSKPPTQNSTLQKGSDNGMLRKIRDWLNPSLSANHSQEKETWKIEDVPQGYPRFSAFLALDKSFQIWRRFSALRTRLLLLKQDELSQLEEQLEAIDNEEAKSFSLNLGTLRADKNNGRREILKEIDVALEKYDAFLERHQRAFSFEISSNHATSNLEAWLENNKSLESGEIEYLQRRGDLFSLLGNNTWSERLAEAIGNGFNTEKTTRDPNIAISATGVRRTVMILLAPVIATLLLTPVIICNYVDDLTYRVVIVVLTTAAFIAALSCLTRVKAVDLVVAGATYATVLVVFISGTNAVNNSI